MINQSTIDKLIEMRLSVNSSKRGHMLRTNGALSPF